MLKHITVCNIALIEEVSIVFDKGLNILSGETGAGKSIIIDAIGFVLGSRVDKDFVRSGAQTASVEAFFTIDDISTLNELAKMNIDISEDNALLVVRSHNIKGRSVCKLNGKTVPLSLLREVSPWLMDIHGQHEHQSLLNPSKHLQLLDRFCHEALEEKRQQLSKYIINYKLLLKKINNLKSGMDDDMIEMYTYQRQELLAANLSKNEEETLNEKRRTLANNQKLSIIANSLSEVLNNDDGACDKLSRSLSLASQMALLRPKNKDIVENLEDIYSQLQDIAANISQYSSNLNHNPKELDELEERLDFIFKLKQKYNKSLLEIIDYYEYISKKLDDMQNSKDILKQCYEQKKESDKDIGRVCIEMSQIRKTAARQLAEQIEGILHDLGMEKARFNIEINRKGDFSINGFDRAEFLISANIGEELASLSKIASGGEMSRVMLALKTALSTYDNIESFIFDEIDTGISGRTAQQVAQKMSIIAKNHQILCITHLPQIAAMGDTNFLIEKDTLQDRTYTNIYKLDNEKTIQELARLIGGAVITDTTIEAAREMKNLASQIKIK